MTRNSMATGMKVVGNATIYASRIERACTTETHTNVRTIAIATNEHTLMNA